MSIRDQDATRAKLLGVVEADWQDVQLLHRKRGGTVGPDIRRFLDGLAALEQYRAVIGPKLEYATDQAVRQLDEYLAHGPTAPYYQMTDETIDREANSGLGVRCHVSIILYVLQGIFETIGREYPVIGPRIAGRCTRAMNVVFLDLYSVFGQYQMQMAAGVARRSAALDEAVAGFRGDIDALTRIITEANLQVEVASHDTAVAVRTASEGAEKTTSELDIAARDFVATAAASDELSASIQEIDRAATASFDAVRGAVEQSGAAGQEVTSLMQAVDDIGSVAGLIKAIAEQTNLLALNATIEAARAGEAGRGFAVVASEVKALASQTAQATQDIGDRIAAIQNGVERSSEAIASVSAQLQTSAAMAETIGTAVRQQRHATSEIAQMMQVAVERANRIARTSSETRQVIQGSAGTSDELRQLSQELRVQTTSLTEAVDRFSKKLRAI